MTETIPSNQVENGADNRWLFTAQEIDQIAKYLVCNQRRYRENMIIPRSFAPTVIKSNEEKRVEAIFESCPFKAVLSLLA
ncbi:Mitochondrial import inner membrane translocase subunit Tim22, partial [Halocaridina rubra]